MGEPRKGGESPRLCYTISRLHKFQVAWNQEHIKTGGEERVTAQPGCGPGGVVGLCLNILFTV